MPDTQTVQWVLWTLSLLFAVGVAVALFRFRSVERFIPDKGELEELKRFEAELPALREELKQASQAVYAQRREFAKLEEEVGSLRQLREWHKANPDAEARLRKTMADVQQAEARLAAIRKELEGGPDVPTRDLP